MFVFVLLIAKIDFEIWAWCRFCFNSFTFHLIAKNSLKKEMDGGDVKGDIDIFF